ncbi:MAG: hypothetical protein LC689_10890, partial [Myxococcales bacterium]|nr:hypothetical protein [Myxococcales bacterium]
LYNRVEASFPDYILAVVGNVFVGGGHEVALAIALAKHGVTVAPPDAGPGSCVANARCDLPNPCEVGQVNCSSGAPMCASSGNAIDGISCGANHICSAGVCVSACIGGMFCRPGSDSCRQGTVSCASGTPTCVAGADPLPDGVQCGQDRVCRAGACVGCVSGAVCAGANPCHSGITDCSTGTQLCKDSGEVVSDGTQCGSNLYCNAGACGACTAGTACDPTGFPCHAGATSCSTGRPVCTDLGTAKTDGTACGQNQVCFAGSCNACAAGQDCTPASNPCHLGSIACGSGQPVCVDQQTNRAPGAACGANRVCDGAGDCNVCGQGQSCTPSNPCHTGAIGCSSGAPVCGDLGSNLADGSGCGAGKYCFQGTCNPCSVGATCPPANPCHLGTISCGTGQPVCSDSGAVLGDGATCGAGDVCLHGACGPCVSGANCDGATGDAAPPSSPDPCKVYATNCTSGAPVCVVAMNQPEGTPCGTGLRCRSGSCQTSTLQITLGSGGQQHALPNQALPNPLVIQVLDLTTGASAGQTVTITPPPGAQATPASAVTDASGNASFTLTLGRAVADQVFSVGVSAAFPPTLAVTETADAPDPGTVIPLVNETHTLGGSGVGGPGPAARVGSLTGVAVASNGDVYFSDSYNCHVDKLSPAGVMTLVAGTICTFGGDSGPATAASLQTPHGLALDETNGILYIADTGNGRVRMVQLSTGLIDTLAGDANAPNIPPYGDGGAARSARILSPGSVAVGPERPNPSVYVTDVGHGLVRKIDGNTGIITTAIPPGVCASPTTVYFDLNSGNGDNTASLAFDGEGNLFVSGRFCGAQLSSAVYGIGRVLPDGTMALVAGSLAGGLGGGSALGARFISAPLIAFDNARDGGGALKNNLYFSSPSNQVLGRIDGASGRLQIIGGTGATGGGGDFGPASSATFSTPFGIAFAPNGRDLIVADNLNYALRMISTAGSPSASTASLALSGGGVQSSYVDQVPPLPIAVALSDGSSNPLAGYTVNFALDPAGLAGASLSNASVQTTLSGVAAVTFRPGLEVGQYGAFASFADIHGDPIPGSPISFALNTTGPANRVFTAVNDAHVNGSASSTQRVPGSLFAIGVPRGLAPAADGTLYFSDNNWHIYRMDRAGIVTRIAGTGGGSYAGDGGPALSAQMQPWGLALDEGSGRLYFADTSSSRIRVIDLASGTVSLIAGGNPSPTPPNNGDGGLAINAALYAPTRIAVANGYLYLGDYSSLSGVRRVNLDPNPANRIIDSLLFPGMTKALQPPPAQPYSPTCSDPPTFWSCYSEPGCQVAFDPSGRLYVSALFCGKDFNNNGVNGTAVPGIVRIEADNTLTRIAGHVGSGLGSGALAGNTGFQTYPPMIRFDGQGNLWVTNGTQVGYFTAGTAGVDVSSAFTQVGDGAPSSPQPGQYDPPSNVFFPSPLDLAFLQGSGSTHVVVADGTSGTYTSFSLRIIW